MDYKNQTQPQRKREEGHQNTASRAVGDKGMFLQDNRPATVIQQKTITALENSTMDAPIQKKENNTGLPDNLKSGIENLSGYAMDDVKVHYNSDKPTQLNAHAYAQGTDIHLASGQEKHLPHEAWHVVQQKQGRVQPTMQMKGKVNINDDQGLEKEADVMGEKALQMKSDRFSNTIQGMSINTSPDTFQLVVEKGLEKGVRVKVINGGYKGREGVIDSEIGYGYKVLLKERRNAITFSRGDLDKINEESSSDEDIGMKEGSEEGIDDLLSGEELDDEPKKTEESPVILDDEDDYKMEDDVKDSTEKTTSTTDKLEKGVKKDEGEEKVKDDSLDDVTGLEKQMSYLILHDNWNNSTLVEAIGAQSWSAIKKAWDTVHLNIEKGDNESAKKKIKKFILVKLRGKPYKGKDIDSSDKDDSSFNYDDVPDNFIGEQKGHKWGVEIEGGGAQINVTLNKINIEKELKDELEKISSEKASEKEINEKIKDKIKDKIKEVLIHLKRTPLIKTGAYTLTIDNVMSKIDALYNMKEVVLFPIEIASTPKDGELKLDLHSDQTLSVNDRKNILKKEDRSKENWPTLLVKEKLLRANKGQSVGLELFNKYFFTDRVYNMKTTTQIQHITKSGNEENRLFMAKELKDTAANFKKGTKGKKALSGKPKTSIELLRHSSMKEDQVKYLEKQGHEIRESLRGEIKGIKFADELLNGIILPTTGAPREVGGYSLSSPMTNVFPLLDKGEGKVTVLREYR